MRELGYNYRLSDIHCALGISQLKKLDVFIKKRNHIAKIYSKNFNKNIYKKPEVKKDSLHAFHLYPLQINFAKLKISKKKNFLKNF